MTNEEKEIVFSLAEQMIGVTQQGSYRKDILIRNVERRMEKINVSSIIEYLEIANNNATEYSNLISALTIHTTSWFRERPHFEYLRKHIENNLDQYVLTPLRVLSIACSTGEEVYSLATMFLDIKSKNPHFNFDIKGIDIDPISIRVAQNGVYLKEFLPDVPSSCHKYFKLGKNKRDKYFAVSKEMRSHCRFKTGSLVGIQIDDDRSDYDIIFCRNVLIYFSPDSLKKIVIKLKSMLSPRGILTLGHSEAIINPAEYKMQLVWNSSYCRADSLIAKKDQSVVIKKKENKIEDSRHGRSRGKNKGKVLIVDDSATVRRVLEKLLVSNGFTVFTASSAAEATVKLKETSVDIISLDLYMPEKNGDVWLQEQRRKGLKIPVIMVTDASINEAGEILGALENGAQDYIKKTKINKSSIEVVERICALIDSCGERSSVQSSSRLITKKVRQKLFHPELIVVGASTGGTEALSKLFADFNKKSPPVIVVQHISPSFALPFAKRLSQTSKLTLGDVKSGTILKSGHIYLSDGDQHIGVTGVGGVYRLALSSKPAVNRHRPSVDFLFDSVVKHSKQVAAILLTGMGSDGGRGLAKLKKEGAITFVQNEASCVVFGMPKDAIERGAAGFIGDLYDIRKEIDKSILMS